MRTTPIQQRRESSASKGSKIYSLHKIASLPTPPREVPVADALSYLVSPMSPRTTDWIQTSVIKLPENSAPSSLLMEQFSCGSWKNFKRSRVLCLKMAIKVLTWVFIIKMCNNRHYSKLQTKRQKGKKIQKASLMTPTMNIGKIPP